MIRPFNGLYYSAVSAKRARFIVPVNQCILEQHNCLQFCDVSIVCGTQMPWHNNHIYSSRAVNVSFGGFLVVFCPWLNMYIYHSSTPCCCVFLHA